MTEFYACGVCERRYTSVAAALRCCAPDGEDDDDDPDTHGYGTAPPAGMPPERYAYDQRTADAEIMADGGVPDVPADTTVYVATTQRGSRNSVVFHTDADCPRLQASNTIHEKTRGVLGDSKSHCKFCAGVAETPVGDHSTYRALADADPDDLVTDGGRAEPIEITQLPYRCRCCQADRRIYVSVEAIDGERFVDAHNARLVHSQCDECAAERPFVLATGQADAARDEHPIQAVRGLHKKRRGQPLRADGGGCPKCGAPIRVEGGCPTCTQCPWAKCGGGF